MLIDSRDARVIVLVDTFQGSGRDGVVDRWFVLQAEEAVPALAEHLESAQIVHSPGSVRILSPANRVLFDLAVAGQQPGTEVPENFKAMAVGALACLTIRARRRFAFGTSGAMAARHSIVRAAALLQRNDRQRQLQTCKESI